MALRIQQQAGATIRNALAAFAADFAMGKAVVIDRFARRITPHDLVLWHPPHDLVYEVVKIEPILEAIPNTPLGQIRVTLELTAPVDFLANHPAMSVLVVGHQVDATSAELHAIDGGQKDNVPGTLQPGADRPSPGDQLLADDAPRTDDTPPEGES